MNKLLGLLSLCRKAGRLRIGFEPVKDSLEAGEARLVLFARDFSPRSRERMERILMGCFSPPPSGTADLTMFDISQVCGKPAGVVAVADDGFAAGIEKLMRETKEEQNR